MVEGRLLKVFVTSLRVCGAVEEAMHGVSLRALQKRKKKDDNQKNITKKSILPKAVSHIWTALSTKKSYRTT